ncbi:hypothetical protein CDD83_4297 [Cordyceps sp. RAO-2017]|nr:hypothetical protein CDD83_4297 [Cordyceps sp. RAO-2017]
MAVACSRCAGIVLETRTGHDPAARAVQSFDHHSSPAELEACAAAGRCDICRIFWARARRAQLPPDKRLTLRAEFDTASGKLQRMMLVDAGWTTRVPRSCHV